MYVIRYRLKIWVIFGSFMHSPYPVPMGGSRLCDGVSQRTCTGALLSSGSLVRRAGVERVVMRFPEKLHVYCPDTSDGKLCTCMVS